MREERDSQWPDVIRYEDIAPAVLHSLSVAVPANTDGTVMTEGVTDDRSSPNVARPTEYSKPASSRGFGQELSPPEERRH